MNTVFSTIVPTALAIGTAIVGLWKVFNEYKRSNEIKEKELRQQRQQVLFPLIKEFEDQNLKLISIKEVIEKSRVLTNRSNVLDRYN